MYTGTTVFCFVYNVAIESKNITNTSNVFVDVHIKNESTR